MSFVANLGIAFLKMSRLHSERSALSYAGDGAQVSYRDLAALTDRIATVLDARGLRQGDVVAMFHDKSPAAFACMLACLRLGLPYANLDPEIPFERLRRIFVSCRPALIVNAFIDIPHAQALHDAGYDNVLHLHDMPPPSASHKLPPITAVGGGAPAYIMFTSGSTGMPKGAVMSHANLLWFIGWAKDRFGIAPEDVLTNVNPIYFDNSVFDFYTAIFNGATLAPLTAQQVSEPRRLVKLVSAAACTIWFSVPSLLIYLLTTRALASSDLPAIRTIIFGGEGFPKTRLRELHVLFGGRANLENVYGPTECTCICSAHTITSEDFDDMQSLAPLGLLAQNFNYRILPMDPPEEGIGELFLIGPQVGLGYYNDPSRTAAAFVQNPMQMNYVEIGYRSGDIVRRDARGRLHFKGRTDFQIKHLGYRIELEEIEAALGTIDGVLECAVIYLEADTGIGEIVAFAAMDPPTGAVYLMDGLAAILPDYMLPRRVFVRDSLPKNANGKIDRVTLKAMA